MKKKLYTYAATGLVVGLVLGIFAAEGYRAKTVEVSVNTGSAGNGAPNGAHYNLNIIGVPKGKTADMTANSGHRIFVSLDGRSKINLREGDFQVLDANGTDSNGAAFQLPNPDPDGDYTTNYSVYVRALGKPGVYANMQTCYTDTTGTWCAVDFGGGVEQISVSRTKGKSTFTNVSKDLLYVDYCTAFTDLNGDGIYTVNECTNVTQVPLFGEEADYFWDYDNNGLKVAQLRFYEVPTTVSF
jgi:hypothetical protein